VADEIEHVTRLIKAAVDDRWTAGDSVMSPGSIAKEVYVLIAEGLPASFLVKATSMNDLRRRAESTLRTYAAEERERVEGEQGDMFSGSLQRSYPCERDGVNVYAPPSLMTDEEGARCVARGRREIETKTKHMDALEGYFASRNSLPPA